MDTIIHNKTGLLSSSLLSIQKNIIKLLKDENLNKELGDNAKLYISKFSPTMIIPKWEALLKHVYDNNLDIEIKQATRNFSDEFKWLRYVNYFIRFKFHIRIIPSVSTQFRA